MKNDASYHLLFSHPEMLEDLVRHFVEEEWVHDLDFKTLKRVNAKFHTDSLKRREGDVIYRVQTLTGHPVYLYLMLEFQSQPDPWMALRINTYISLLWQHLVKEKQLTPNGRLPPVIGLVLYNGDTSWCAPTQLSDLIDLAKDSPLQSYMPRMLYYLIEERKYLDGKEDAITGYVFKLENCRSSKQLLGIIDEITAFLEQPKWRKIRRDFLIWLQQVCLPSKGLKLEPIQTENLSEVKSMLKTRIAQWEKELLEKGIKQGREEGIEKGKMSVLERQLVLKFGSLPDWAKKKFENASADQLEKWALKIFDAKSIQELLK